jgi:phosphoglycerate dehydrogenase-like enzyme
VGVVVIEMIRDERKIMSDHFRIGVTADMKVSIPGRMEPILEKMLDPLPNVDYTFFEITGQDEWGKFVRPEDVADFDAVLAFAPRFTAASFTGNERLAIISRWGVGYDMIDVPACTTANVLLAITTDAVRRPVAEAIVTLLHALSTRLFDKDR